MREVHVSSADWDGCVLMVADSPFLRLRGLIGRPPETGLLIDRRSVHGFFMARDLDVVFLDSGQSVLEVRRLERWRTATVREAAMSLELPAGIEPPPIGAHIQIAYRSSD